MNLVIHNLHNLENNIYVNRQIFFNPWGFSRMGIEKEILGLLNSEQIADDLSIYFCMKDLFFGRRSQIAFNAIVNGYPKNRVVKMSEIELISFLNKPSI